jgi:hypothetical protein
MKTMTKYILMAVAGMLALSSCSNDDNEPVAQNAPRQMTFSAGYNEGAQTRATMDFSTKKVSFDAGDEISILSANNTNKEFTTEAGGASASFSGEAVNDTKFYAVYPYTAGLTLDSSTGVISGIEIPKSQWNNQFGKGYAGKSSWDPKAPIAYAVTTDENLQFHNLCAILKIKATGGWYGSMTISADQDLAGTFKLDTSTGTLTPTDGSKTVTIGNTSLEISASNMYMYIAIAPGSYTNFKVHAEGTDDRHQQQEKTKSSVTFAAGKIYDLGAFDPQGRFSVSATKKVYFSQGNLQATYNGSSWSWAFAEHQWDFIGRTSGNICINGDGTVSANNVTVDLFGWVGASSNWTGAAQYGISNSETANSTETYGNVARESLKSDWGTLAITNGGNTANSGWYTLSSDEWKYLFDTRESGSTVGDTYNARYAYATINTDVSFNQYGMILFPDGVTISQDEFQQLGTINTTSTTWCTSAQWAALAAKGCVFLPLAGFRNGSTVDNLGCAYYWSSSAHTEYANTANILQFSKDIMSPQGQTQRYYGCSVRLVRPVE